MAALEELEAAYAEAQGDAAFQAELDDLLKNYCGQAYSAVLCLSGFRSSARARRFI